MPDDIDKIAKALASPRPRNGDELSTGEAEELRALAGHQGDLREFCSRRRDEEPGLTGIWSELKAMGLIQGIWADNELTVFGVTPRGVWAVERHDARKAEKDREERSRRHHDWLIALATGGFGLIGVIVGSLLERLLI